MNWPNKYSRFKNILQSYNDKNNKVLGEKIKNKNRHIDQWKWIEASVVFQIWIYTPIAIWIIFTKRPDMHQLEIRQSLQQTVLSKTNKYIQKNEIRSLKLSCCAQFNNKWVEDFNTRLSTLNLQEKFFERMFQLIGTKIAFWLGWR